MGKEVSFSYQHALVDSADIETSGKRLDEEVGAMRASRRYIDKRAPVNLCEDGELHKNIHSLARTIKKHKPAYLVVVGIGGSNLGTQAVQQFVQGKMHNEHANGIKILYADTADSDEISEIMKIILPALKGKERVCLNCISKSGTTTETIANFEVLLEIVKKYDKKYAEMVVVTTDFDSPLYRLASEQGFHKLVIPRNVGGRYSVLSAVGLFPLEMAGVDIDSLLEGAREMKKRCLNMEIGKNPAALSALVRYNHALNNQTIQDLFLFGNDFKSLGKWYRQLFAESLGKGCDIHNRKCVGITPTYSIGSADMHSIAQLYLGGPFDKLTTFVRVSKNRTDIKLPRYQSYESAVKNIQGRKISEIMDAIYNGVKNAFFSGSRPFCEISLPDKSEHSIGQFIQMQMMEVIYLAALLNVDAFDQPDIEGYKEETRRLLARK